MRSVPTDTSSILHRQGVYDIHAFLTTRRSKRVGEFPEKGVLSMRFLSVQSMALSESMKQQQRSAIAKNKKTNGSQKRTQRSASPDRANGGLDCRIAKRHCRTRRNRNELSGDVVSIQRQTPTPNEIRTDGSFSSGRHRPPDQTDTYVIDTTIRTSVRKRLPAHPSAKIAALRIPRKMDSPRKRKGNAD